MSVIPLLASQLNRRDEIPNTELAERLVSAEDTSGIEELVNALGHKNKDIRHDAIKVLYESGAKKPALIAPYLPAFLSLLMHKDNRLQWGAMAALDTICSYDPDGIYAHLGQVLAAADAGSVITKDHAVNILIKLAGHDRHSPDALLLLGEQLQKALPNQLSMYAERALPAMARDKKHFAAMLELRLDDIEKDSKKQRVLRVIRKLKG